MGKSLEPKTELGKRLRNRRLELGLTLEQVADQMGVTYGYLSTLETGTRKSPTQKSRYRIEQLASILQLDVTELLSLLPEAKAPGRQQPGPRSQRRRTRQRKPRHPRELLMTEGLRLKAFRLKHGILQCHLGELLNVGARAISNIERGIRPLYQEEVEAIERKYQASLDSVPIPPGLQIEDRTVDFDPDRIVTSEDLEFLLQVQKGLGDGLTVRLMLQLLSARKS